MSRYPLICLYCRFDYSATFLPSGYLEANSGAGRTVYDAVSTIMATCPREKLGIAGRVNSLVRNRLSGGRIYRIQAFSGEKQDRAALINLM